MASSIDIWDRFEAMLQACAPGLLASLRPPATVGQIVAAETVMSLQLPSEVRTAYLRHDGTVTGNFPRHGDAMLMFVPSHWWASLDEMTARWVHKRAFNEEARVSDPDLYPSPEPRWDQLKVKPIFGNERWVPIGLSGTISTVYVDLDPAPEGTLGQLMTDDGMLEPSWLANSFDHYLEMLIKRVERGTLIFRDGWIWTETDERVYDWNRIG